MRIAVLADSTAFIDGAGPQMPETPHLWPQVCRAELSATGTDVEVDVVARAGLTVRGLWDLLSGEQHVQFNVIRGADVVVLGIGSFDHAPAGVPAVVGAVVPFLRPTPLRRAARRIVHRAYPYAAGFRNALVTRTSWMDAGCRTPWSEFDRLYRLIVTQVRGLSQGAPIISLGPTSHRSDYYGGVHPQHAEREARQLRLAAELDCVPIPVWRMIDSAALNEDGIHWSASSHRAVGVRVAEEIAAVVGSASG